MHQSGRRRDHVVDPLLAPGRQPARVGHGLQRALAQGRLALVERDEPLRGGAEDDRVLAAPADRVGVRVLARLQQGAALAQELDDGGIRVEHALAGEVLDLGQEAPRLVDRAVDVEPVAHAGQVVVPAVAGGGVHDARAGVERHVVGEQRRLSRGRSRGGGSAGARARCPSPRRAVRPGAPGRRRGSPSRSSGPARCPSAPSRAGAPRSCPRAGRTHTPRPGGRPGRGWPAASRASWSR